MNSLYGAPTGGQKLRGTGYRSFNTPTLDASQQELLSGATNAIKPDLAAAISRNSGLASGNVDWSQLEAPALRQFSALQGNTASRFSGIGSGARRSSGFQNEMSGEASNLAERLQSQRMGIQNDALDRMMKLYDSIIGTKTFDTTFAPQKSNWLKELLGSIVGQGTGAFAGSYGARLGGGYGQRSS